MKVYICYECDYDYCSVWRNAVKVFDDEAKALVWREDFTATPTDWREYEEMDLE